MSRALVANPARTQGEARSQQRPRKAAPGQTPTPAARAWRFAVIIGALVMAVAGMAGIRQIAADRDASLSRASIGGVRMQLQPAEWVEGDHDMSAASGFQMPSQMMPGMPTGDDARLSIPATFTNTAGAAVRFNPVGEFVLRGGGKTARGLTADTFGQIKRIVSQSAVNGLLYFDIPPPKPGDPPFYLEWRRDGRVIRLAVPMGAPHSGGHDH